MNKLNVAGALCLALPTVFSPTVDAKGLGQQKLQPKLEEVIVIGEKQNGSLTSVSVKQAREILEQIPGGIGFVDVSDYQDNFTQSLGDTLVFTPGVFADTSAQRENRISIRGSGLNSSFERRGINVYRDGVPITRASGITEFQEIDPLSVKYIEVFKGSNGLRFGTNALGGAINIVTPTGRNSETKNAVRLEAGSFGSTRLNLSSSGKTDKFDYYAAFTKLDSNGFRTHSDVDSTYGFGNVGVQLTDNIETRFYITSLQDDFELAGSTTLTNALENPETAVGETFVPARLSFLGGPGLFSAVDDDWDRNLKVERFANRTTIGFNSWSLEVGAWFANRELDHAITRFAGIIVQEEDEIGFNFRASNEREANEALIWSVGVRYNESDNEAKRFRNEFGERGNQSSQDFQDSNNLAIFGQISLPINDKLNVIAGAQYVRSVRENQHSPLNRFDLEDDSGSLTFDEIAPRVGLLWAPSESQQVYLNLSRAYEAPGISDLTSAGVLPFSPLEIQQSTTVEIGTRGQANQWSWDISAYRSNIENEFIDLTSGFVTNTVNSESDTTHQGIEAGIDWLPIVSVLEQNKLSLAWRNVLTVNDFTFDNHPVYGNNDLAGVPQFSYLTELSLRSDSWKAGLNLRYVDDGPYVDFANTIQSDGYTLVGFNASWNINDSIRLFASAENVTDKVYISNINTLGLATQRSQVFTPGQGRAAYAGISLDF